MRDTFKESRATESLAEDLNAFFDRMVDVERNQGWKKTNY